MRFRYWYRILSVSLTAMLLVVAAGCSTTASGAKSAPITKAAGGMLNLDAAGTVQIPPGGVDGDGFLHARASDSGPETRPDPVFKPLGPALKVDLDGARLTGAAFLEFRVPPAPDGAQEAPFSPIWMYYDDAARKWVPAASHFDAARQLLIVQTQHLSWWRPFSWDWSGVRDFVKGLADGTFGVDVLAGASAPTCNRENEARAKARSEVTAGDHLLWCVDLDASDELLLRVVNNRRMALQVQMFPGVQLAERPMQPLSVKYLGPITEQWLAARNNLATIVLGPGEAATFHVTDLTNRTGVGTTPSAVSYVTDVLDIGIEELSWTFGKFGLAATTDKEQLYRTLFADGRMVECLSAGLNDKSVVADPSSAGALGRSLGELVLGCIADEAENQLPTLAAGLVTAAAFLGSLVKTGLRAIQDLLAAGEYLTDLVSGRNNFFIALSASPTPGTGAPGPSKSAPAAPLASGGSSPEKGNPGGSVAPPVAPPVQKTAPPAPSNLIAKPGDPTSIELSWSGSGDASGFEINNGETSRSAPGNAKRYVWTGLHAGEYMCFKIRAISDGGQSAWTPQSSPYYVCATTPDLVSGDGAPSAPTDVHTDQFYGTLKWTDTSPNEQGFHIYQNGRLVGTEPANSTQFHGTMVGACSDTITVGAYNAAGETKTAPISYCYSHY